MQRMMLGRSLVADKAGATLKSLRRFLRVKFVLDIGAGVCDFRNIQFAMRLKF